MERIDFYSSKFCTVLFTYFFLYSLPSFPQRVASILTKTHGLYETGIV